MALSDLEGELDGGQWVCLEVNLPSYGSKDGIKE